MPGTQQKPKRAVLAIRRVGACLWLAVALSAAAGGLVAHARDQAHAPADGREDGTPASSGSIEGLFRPTARPERLVIPIALEGGKTTARTYRAYVLIEASAEGTAGTPPRPLEPIWTNAEGRFGSFAGPQRLSMGFAGSSAHRRGAEPITGWTVYVPGEGWKDPLGEGEAGPGPRPDPSHRYCFVIYLGEARRRLTLGTGTTGARGGRGDGRYVVSLTPLAVRPGVAVPAKAHSWTPISPDLLNLRGRRLVPARTTDMGPRRWRTVRAPSARITGAGPTRDYEVAFPGSDMLPVRRGGVPSPWGMASRDRITLPSGLRVRVTAAGRTAALSITGRPEPLTFGYLLTDPELWTPKEINDTTYSLNRGYSSRDAYDLFGLAKLDGQAYVGVVWYSPGASFNPREMGLLLRLGPNGRPALVRKVLIEGENYRGFPGPPLMDVLPDGRMVVVQHSRMWLFRPGNDWHEVHATLPKYQSVWLRGPRLLFTNERSYRASAGYPVEIRRTDVVVRVQDVLSRQPIREIHWSILAHLPNSLYDTAAE